MKSSSTDNFIIRIYRRKGGASPYLVGIVEQVGVEGKWAFHNWEELWALLLSPPSKRTLRRGRS